MSFARFFSLLTIAFLTFSCQSDRWGADTSKVVYDAEFSRLDRDVFNIEPANAASEVRDLSAEMGPFLDVYLGEIMRVGPASNPMSAELLMRFTTDPMWRELQETIDKVHPNLTEAEAALGEALRRYSVHFNTEKLPSLVAYNSGFNVGIFPSDSVLGVGLEWYSGSDFDIIKQLPPDLFPQYKRDKMQPEYLVVNALKGWLSFKYQNELQENDMLSRMVFSGKVLYTTEALIGETDARVLHNYSPEELAWCLDKEFDIWKHFVEQDLLFSKDQMAIAKMMNDGPFTPGMPPESPGGVGSWIGYRMVKAFMDKNEKLTLPDLMGFKADKEILKFYKPGR